MSALTKLLEGNNGNGDAASAGQPGFDRDAQLDAVVDSVIRPSEDLRCIGLADFHLVLYASMGLEYDFSNPLEDQLHEFSNADLGIPTPMLNPTNERAPQSTERASGRRRRGSLLVSAANLGIASFRYPTIHHEIVDRLLKRTDYRVTLRTNDASIADQHWLDLFLAHRERITVGLVIPTLNDDVLAKLDPVGSNLADRIRAYRMLHQAGITTCAFLCPVLPDIVPHLDAVFREIQVERLTTIWAAPFHQNYWQRIQKAFGKESPGHPWFTAVFKHGHDERWSRFAADFYLRLALKGRAEGWFSKVRFLLDEQRIRPLDALLFDELDRVILLGPTDPDGYSKNPGIRRQQKKVNFWNKDAQFPNGHPARCRTQG
jgi:hypothetical protein